MIRSILAMMLVAVLAAGCDTLSKGPYAMAQLTAANGSAAWGRVSFHQSEGKTFIGESFNWSAPVAQSLVDDTAGKTFMRADINGLPMNRNFVISLHERGDCSAGGSLVGPVFNPDVAVKAGAKPPVAPLDMPKMTSDGEGVAMYMFTTSAVTVAPGPRSVVNRAVVVRERTQDLLSSTVNLGDVLACGVVKSMD